MIGTEGIARRDDVNCLTQSTAGNLPLSSIRRSLRPKYYESGVRSSNLFGRAAA
jgi:hypothetical protein